MRASAAVIAAALVGCAQSSVPDDSGRDDSSIDAFVATHDADLMDAPPDAAVVDDGGTDVAIEDAAQEDAPIECMHSGLPGEPCRVCTGPVCFDTVTWACRDGDCRRYCTSCVDPGYSHCAGPPDAGACVPP